MPQGSIRRNRGAGGTCDFCEFLRLVLALLALASCSRREDPPPPAPAPEASQVYEPRIPPGPAAQFLETLTAQDGRGAHGRFHQIKSPEEREFWKVVSQAPVSPGGDHLLALAIERVYTRYDVNFYHGAIWHWPYLNSRKAVQLAEKLLREYPRSPLTEQVLWLQAFALRCPPMDPNEEYAQAFENYREQMLWKPDFQLAREIYGQIARRFPEGRHGAASRLLGGGLILVLELPSGPDEPDPRFPK
jgi:hypothetical protein